MPTSFDLGRILNVDPEDKTCVGTTLKNERCKKPTNKQNQATARALLSRMDRSRDLLDVIPQLEILAGLLLCKEYHNSNRAYRTSYSQVSDVSRVWKSRVEAERLRLRAQEIREDAIRGLRVAREQEGRMLRIEAERTVREQADQVARVQAERVVERVTREQLERTERQQRARAARVEAHREAREELERLARREEEEEKRVAREEAERISTSNLEDVSAQSRSTINEASDELEEKQPDMISQPESTSEPSVAFDETILPDPFLAQASSSSRSNTYTLPTPPFHRTVEMDALADNLTSASDEEMSVRAGKQPEQTTGGLPSVPEQEALSPCDDPKIVADPKFEDPLTSMSAIKDTFGSSSKRAVPVLAYETPIKVKRPPIEDFGSSSSTTSTAFSGFSLESSTTSTSAITEPEPEAEPAGELENSSWKGKGKVVTPINMSSSSTPGSMFIFGSGNEKQFELQAPITPQKPSAADSNISSSAPSDPSQNNNIATQPITPTQIIEDSYGYADITPSSTRYTTYLPARQRYGLLTPPETPETLLGAFVKPTDECHPSNSGNEERRRREEGSPVPRMTRKPLPDSSPEKTEIGAGYEEGCATCGRIRGRNVGGCECGEIYEQEVEGQQGCLERFGFWRLVRKVERKLKDMKGSGSK